MPNTSASERLSAGVRFVKSTLVTPARDQGILTGVMRQALIHNAAHLGLAVEERAVKPAELGKADAVFLTNSLRFIRPVTALSRLAEASRPVLIIFSLAGAAVVPALSRPPRNAPAALMTLAASPRVLVLKDDRNPLPHLSQKNSN